ncbi:MAG TPA: LPS assembly protein LptD [Candidatus Tripitaka californicus]|uniref:LPS assembly protein LptD n=1 Tax=Candidatus Tripitaka californicus TaxID=3367616 RepID=UPI00402772F0|nr:LPS-assembly protein LptD [Planctomycetota bacterium]
MTAPFSSSAVLPLQREWLCYLVLGLAIWLTFGPSALSQEIITLETTPYPINLTAESISTWQKEGVRVFLASNNVWITQGKVLITADQAALLFYEQEAVQQKEAKVDVYCETKVTLVQDKDVQHYEQLFVRLDTASGIVVNPRLTKVLTYEDVQPTATYMRAIEIRDQRRGGFTSREPVVYVGKAPGTVDIVADDIDSWVEGNQRIVTALGNVVLQKDAITMEADNAILWFEEEKSDGKKKHVFKELYAEGNVILKSPEDIRKADKIFQSLTEKKAIYINPWIKTKMPEPPFLPIYMGGKEAKQIDQDHTIVKDAYFTTCNFSQPHYRFNSRNLTITQRKTPVESYSEIVARHNTFRVGERPIAYLPKYTYDTRTKSSFFKGFGAGSSNRLGLALTTTWDPLALGVFPELNRWMHTVVKLDYLSKRGPAAGTEIFYKRPNNMDGYLETFYVKDHAENDQTTGLPVQHENRGRVLWRHRQHINKEWRADAELSYLSDRAFLREYYEPEFKTGKAQETDLYFRRLQDNKGLTFLAKKQIHSFDTGPEALPQLGYQLISQPLWEDRLNLSSQSSLGYLDFRIDDKMKTLDPARYQKLKRTTGSSIRMDTDNTLSWPFQFWVMKFRPFVGSRVTAYSKSTKDQGPNDGPAVGRLATSLGLDASTNFWRIYSTESKLLRINKLRHVITPDLRWEAGPTVTKNADHLLQYEPLNAASFGANQNIGSAHTDGLDKYNALVFGIRNRFQTRRGPQLRTVDLLDLDMEVHLLTSPSDGPEGNTTHFVGNAEGYLIPKKHSFLQPDIRAQLTDRLALASERSEFNLDDFRFDFYNVGITFQNSPKWYQFLGYRFIRDISSTVSVSTNLVVKEKWSLSVGETYDFKPRSFTGAVKDAQSLGTSIILGRRSHDFNNSLFLNFDVVNKNTSFGFNITPVGVKRPVGQTFSFAPTP